MCFFTADNLRSAARSIASTATGGDSLAPSTLCDLPPENLESLASVMKAMVQDVALPLQQLHNVLVTTPQKSGGVRCIALMPSISRIFTSLLGGELTSWDKAVAHDTDSLRDTAAPGSVSRLEAMRRQLRAEVAAWLREPYGQCL